MTVERPNTSGVSVPVLMLGLAGFLVFVYWETFAGMIDLWGNSSHQHGPLVFPIVAYLVWRMQPQTRDVGLSSSPAGVLLVALLVFVWTVSRLAGIQIIEQASLLALMPAAVLAIGGWRITNKLLFPLCFIVLAVPIGDAVVPYLIAITADVSSALLRLSGVPVLRNGNHMTLPGGDFVVAEVCSGARYLLSGLIIALLFSYLSFRNYTKRVVFVAVAVVVLLLGNGLRAYIVMAVASASNMKYLSGADHVYFGWVLFGVLILSLMWIGGRFEDETQDAEVDRTAEGRADGDLHGGALIALLGLAMLAATLNPLQSQALGIGKVVLGLAVLIAAVFLTGRHLWQGGVNRGRDRSIKAPVSAMLRSGISVAIVAGLLVGGPYLVGVLERAAPSVVAAPNIDGLQVCSRPQPWMHDWSPRMRDADYESSATLDCQGTPVSVFVAAYASALQGRELVSGSNRIVPRRWQREGRASEVSISAANGRSVNVRELVIDSAKYTGLVWYWYGIDGKVATSGLAAKVLQVWALLRRQPAGGHVVVIASPIDVNDANARGQLEIVAESLLRAGATEVSTGDGP